MPADSLRTLLTDLIDYAGLFPPAGLSMPRAVEAYAGHLRGEHEWMLGRFICPVSRLAEFSTAAGPLLPGTVGTSGYREADVGEPWRLSVLIDGPVADDLAMIDEFNARHEDPAHGRALIDAVEMKVTSVSQIDEALDQFPEDLLVFFELPVNQDCRGYVAALAGERAAAKIRTGGVVPGAFPTPREVVAFINACAAADVPFKATAGLHHPVRGIYPLTYEPNAPHGTMYGFLNIFLTAAFVRIKGPNDAEAVRLLTDEEPDNFRFADEVVNWQGHGLETTQIAMARERFALSFGSCSFDEPVRDLRAAGLLEP
jgi:hypothetical protein